jgi:hypothetical protein
MSRRTLLTCILLSLLLLLIASHFASAQSGVPDARFARLLKGVSITRWFWYPEFDSREEAHYLDYISDTQLADIRALGFMHIRLPIEPRDLVNEAAPDQLDGRLLGFLDLAINRMIAQDLAVIIDPHNWDEAWFARLENEPAAAQAFTTMWGALAAHLSRTNPDMVFLEVLNEPMTENAEFWQKLQAQTAAAIRSYAPLHTIIVGGTLWNSIDGLLNLTPLEDPNVVYNFHFYEPHIFTHQGAIWGGEIGYLRGVPYPSDHWNGCDFLPEYGYGLDAQIDDYCYNAPWSAARIDERIRLAWQWGQQYGVRLTANEFGVMPTAPYADRLAWIRDVRESLERYGIGWTIWGYDDAFGLDAFGFGAMDGGVLMALGM